MIEKNNTTTILEKTIKESQEKFLLKTTLDFKELKSVEFGSKVTEVELECEGYGYFPEIQEKILNNFVQYFKELKKNCTSKITIKTLRITLNGFDIGEEIKTIIECIKKISNEVQTFSFHTADLTGVEFTDFVSLFELIDDLKKNKDFSLQCANWKFKGNPPTLSELLGNLGDGIGLFRNLPQKKLRLEISGWYYDEEDAKHFIKLSHIKEIKNEHAEAVDEGVRNLHEKLSIFLSELLSIFECLEELEFDMRNTHPMLQMDKLKKYLISNPLAQREENNMMSMKLSKKIGKEKGQNNKDEIIDKEKKLLKIVIEM